MGIKTVVRSGQAAFDETVNAYLANGAELVNSFITPTLQFVAILEGKDFSSELVAGEVKEVIKEVIKKVEVEKIVEVDNPEHLKTIAALEKENKTLKSQNTKLQSKINKLIEE